MNDPKLRIREDYARILYRVGLVPAFWRSLGFFLTVLNYHQFVPAQASSFLEVSHNSLRGQLDHLRKIAHLVPIARTLKKFSAGYQHSHHLPMISLTVDDGHRSLLDVLPIFEEFSTPLTVFLPIGLIIGEDADDGCQSFLLRYRCLTPESNLIPELKINRYAAFSKIISASTNSLRKWLCQIEEDCSSGYRWPNELLSLDDVQTLAKHPLVTICSHSMSHLRLSVLPEFLMEWEIEKSIGRIRQFGGDTSLFAYPYGVPGTYNRLTNSILRKSGISFAFSSISFPTLMDRSSFVFGRSFVLDSCDGDYVRGLGYGAFEIWDRMRHFNYWIRRPWDLYP